MYHNGSYEQRHYDRFRLNGALFAAIQGDNFYNPACVVDLNRAGGCISWVSDEDDLTGKYIKLDLISDKNRSILRSLQAKVVYFCADGQNENNQNNSAKRYGLQFVNLTALERRMLDHITRKYALQE